MRRLFRGRYRVREQRAFEAVFRQGKRLEGPGFVLAAANNRAGFARLGVAVSRRNGSAVARNRVKRIVREAFRGASALRAVGADFIVVVRNGREMRSMESVRAELERRASLMTARRWIRQG